MISNRRVLPFWFFSVVAVALVVLLAVFLVRRANTDDAKPQESAAAGGKTAKTEQKSKKKNPPKKDPYQVPDGKPAKLQAFIKSLIQTPPKDRKDVPKIYRAILQASEKILAAKSDDPTRMFAVQIKFAVLTQQAKTGDKQAAKSILDFGKSLEKDKNKKIREVALIRLLFARAAQIPLLDNKHRQKLTADAIAFVKQGQISLRMGVAIRIAESFKKNNRPDDAASLYVKLSEMLSKSGDKQAAEVIPQLQGYARGLTLLGKTIDIKGKTVDGKPFKWSDYKGKVVLIDFWATWCGPCVFELPNVKRNYDLYHQQGFEVVGISLDSSKRALTAFLKDKGISWTNLFGTDEKNRGWKHPMAVYYGVNSIPNVILVDQTGKVVSTNARGPQLGRLLKKLLGSPNSEKTKAKSGKDSKASKTVKGSKFSTSGKN